jgi:hypothetical protein
MQIKENYTTHFNYQNIYIFVIETLTLAYTYFEPD